MNLLTFVRRRPAATPVETPPPPLSLENLRPRSWGELLDAAMWLYRSQLGTYLGIVFVTQIPIAALQALVTALFFNVKGNAAFGATQTVTLGIAFSNVGFILLSGLAQTFATTAIIYTATHSYFGQPLSLFAAYRLTFKHWGRWISTNIATGALFVIFFLILLVPCAGWLVGSGLFFFGALLISPLTLPVAVLEPCAISQIPFRAWHLARRRFWWTLGYTGVLSLFSMFFAVSPLLFFNALVSNFIGDFVTYNSATLVIWQNLLQNLTQEVFSALFIPLSTLCYTLLYLDLRTRTEGLDLALRAQLAQTPGPLLTALKSTPQPIAPNLITWQEVGYLTLLGLGAGILYFSVLFTLPLLMLWLINAL